MLYYVYDSTLEYMRKCTIDEVVDLDNTTSSLPKTEPRNQLIIEEIEDRVNILINDSPNRTARRVEVKEYLMGLFDNLTDNIFEKQFNVWRKQNKSRYKFNMEGRELHVCALPLPPNDLLQ